MHFTSIILEAYFFIKPLKSFGIGKFLGKFFNSAIIPIDFGARKE
jgi:hypothetical protein